MHVSTFICILVAFFILASSSEDIETLRSQQRVARIVLEELRKSKGGEKQ